MIRPRWHKVWHDLWDNKIRSLLVMASIFIGVFSVGMSIAMYVLIGEDLNTSYAASNPDHAELYISPVNPDLLDSLRRVPGVARVEGRATLQVQLRVGPDEWIPMQISALSDFTENQINILKPEEGVFPPANRQLLIERASLAFTRAELGDVVEIKLVDETIRQIPMVGSVFDSKSGTGSVLGIYGYVTLDTMEWLHEPQYLSRIAIQVSDDTMNKAHIEEVANRVAEQIKKSGAVVGFIFVPDPGRHPASSSILGVTAVIGVLGFLSMFLAGFLIFNTFAALLTQHIRQIGVMKAIGARTSQVVGMYFVLIFAFSILASLPAVPLATYGAVGTAEFMANQFNIDSLGFRIVPAAVIVQAIVGLAIPLLAGLIPVMTGARITIHTAISNYGMGQGRFGKSIVDRLVESIRILSRPMLISLRNTFRRKGRLVLTLMTLVLGGAIFIGVFSLRSSLVVFIEQIGNYFLSDVNISFGQLYPVQKVEDLVLQIPGVEQVEAWTGASGDLLDEEGNGVEAVALIAPPANSKLIEPVLLEGRWLQEGDENAIVLNNAFWRARPDLKVGDEIRTRINQRETTWKVVGFFKFPGEMQLIAYTSYEYLTHLQNEPNRAAAFRIVGSDHSTPGQMRLAKLVETVCKQNGLQVAGIQTGNQMTEANAQAINIIVGFFLFNAVQMALVGAIGLMGTMSMNVIERTREIGVMRAIGASDRTVLRLILVEGLLIGLISWAIGAALAIPISNVLYDVLSRTLFQTSGTATITADGFIIWLFVAIVLSTIASYLPARNAARMTVREILAYE